MARLIERVGAPNLGMNFDPSHLFPAGDMPHYATRSGRPRASATLLAGNEGPLLVGQRPAGGIWPALDSRIEAHVGPLTYDLEQGTVSRPTTAEAVPAAVRLTRSEVGPEAA